jgi:predicted nucleotidyltransferase
MTFEQVHDNRQVLLLQCISGSKAYGLDTPQSDTDIKGVFTLPKHDFFGLHYTEQVANPTNDMVYYELGRFVELLLNNNPNILELLATPADKILHKNPVMDLLKPEIFLSKLCCNTFAGYAQSQIHKAKSLNKKIFKPMEEERKGILDFCYVIKGYNTIPIKDWLEEMNFDQHECGLINIPHSRDMYAVFHQSQTDEPLRGICSENDGNEVRLSSIPKRMKPLALMSYNKDGYSIYCKDYAQYWDWVKRRNEVRYENTLQHGKNYDAKNMMHTFRLLNMAEEIAVEKRINVFRRDRDFLFKVRNGEFLYEELVAMANEKMARIEQLFILSDLPDQPDKKEVNELLVSIREQLYHE